MTADQWNNLTDEKALSIIKKYYKGQKFSVEQLKLRASTDYYDLPKFSDKLALYIYEYTLESKA